ncbi:hypothetical protein ACFLU5_08190 [Bacteroidota bacterium]
MRKYSIILLFPFVFFSCGIKELKEENKAMREELDVNRRANSTLYEITILLDSIDANRDNMYMNLEAGTTYDEYIDRMENLNEYVKKTEQKLSQLEDAISKSDQTNLYLSTNLKKLRKELMEKSKQIKRLEDQVDKYRTENQDLMTLVSLQEAEIADKEAEIETRNEELAFIEAHVDELLKQAQVSEADAFYARAQAVEEAARRTKLAPKKKKQTLMEALELYEQALLKGKEEARTKVDELKKRLRI